MTTRTPADHTIASAAPASSPSPRLVVWLELPAPEGRASDAAREPMRDTWYDPAALYEEPERWDGMA